MPSFFCNDTATTEIYTLSLHDALPIFDHSATSPVTRIIPFEPARAPFSAHPIATMGYMPRTHIAIIGAPLDLGQNRRGVDMGPSAVRVANLQARLASLGR